MRYAGLFEAIRVRASGYAFRKAHEQFFMRYRAILPKKDRQILLNSKDDLEKCSAILKELKEDVGDDLQVGKTKVFFRPNGLQVLERARDNSMLHFAIILQSIARGIIARARSRRLKEVHRKCKIAIESDKVEQVEEAIQYAQALGVEILILRTAEDLLNFLKQEARIVKQIQDAVESKELDKLIGAIDQANKFGLTNRSKKTDFVKKLLEDAQTCKFSLERIREVKKLLRQAMTEDNVKLLEVFFSKICLIQ
jgi:myosin heavy subunit